MEQRLVVRPTNSVPGPAAKRLKIEVVIHTREVYKQFNQICIYISISSVQEYKKRKGML